MTPKENEVLKVYTTKDYSLFKTLSANRAVNKIHLARLKESMKKNYLTTILTVNEKFEIIDGQHRFLVCKELNLPINYILSKNYGLNEVQILNANMKNWHPNDYISGYCDLGYQDYIIFREFAANYGLSNQMALSLLGGASLGGGQISLVTKLKDGSFKVKDLNYAKAVIEKVIMIKPYYKGYLQRHFI